jgi:hypothetical protein
MILLTSSFANLAAHDVESAEVPVLQPEQRVVELRQRGSIDKRERDGNTNCSLRISTTAHEGIKAA